jgi:isoamylase
MSAARRSGALAPCEPAGPGASWDGRGTRFCVWSQQAHAVELCLFDAGARHEIARLAMPECTDGLWHGYAEGVGPGTPYGFRVAGPYDPAHGQRFNPHKLLLDPYARAVAGAVRWNDALYGYHVGSAKADLSLDRRDSAPFMPKALVTSDHFDWDADRPPRTPWRDSVIYELHVRGFSMRRDAIPEAQRGGFAALAHPASIEHLRRLGITAVELLPVHLFARDRHLLERGLTNYWGYNTLGFFCPDPAYGTPAELKWAIRELHAAGIEVILDVVYNHSCEGNELGPTLSWRGFGNAEYYRLLPDQPRYFINDTGCGNAFDFTRSQVIRMVMDSLRHWVRDYHVDGFRFDLGVALGRESYGFDPGSGFFDALLQDPLLSQVKLISEPWDIGPGGYQIGNHPPRMAEWNGLFRDEVRRYWRNDDGMRGALAARLLGSADRFDHHRRRAWASVNFVTAHDGFTLEDVVSFEGKHNEDNGEDNRDGADNNDSCNWGSEGQTHDAPLLALRDTVKRSMLATLLLAQGTPMLLAGDEVGHSQAGNNNAYCQDNEISWIDWGLLAGTRSAALCEFAAQVVALRRRHRVLRIDAFLHSSEALTGDIRDAQWFDERAVELAAEDWSNGAARLLALRRGIRLADGTVELSYLMCNADSASHRFTLPAPRLPWTLALHSSAQPPAFDAGAGGSCELAPHSLALLLASCRDPS